MPGKYVGPRGPRNAKLVFVGEAPGANEERVGQPFVGPAGETLDGLALSVGFDTSQCFYTNLARERPPGNEIRAWFDDNGMPNEIVLRGLEELKAELAEIRPNVIVPLGNYPLKLLTGKGKWKRDTGYSGITDYRGSILEGSPICAGAKCIPTYHPAAVLRNYPLRHISRIDLQRALEQSAFPEIRRPRKFFCIDPQGVDRDAWGRWMVSEPGTLSPPFIYPGETEISYVRSDPFLTGDIEYTGSQLHCLGCTRHADVAVCFPTRTTADIQFVRDILLSGIPLCFQNGMFDCSILEWFYNIDCTRYLHHDTMIAMHAAYTELPKDLGFIASIYTEQPVWWDVIDWKKIRSGEQSIEIIWPYNCIDVWTTHSAMIQLLANELQDQDVFNTYRHEMALIRPLWEISTRGVRIDTANLQALRVQLEEEVGTLNAGLCFLNDGVPVNTKGHAVARLLYDKLDVPRGPKTAGGQWKMDDTTLADLLLKAKNDVQRNAIKMVRAARERRDLISKFCNIELDDDGRMRCHYDPAKTETGRLSSRKFYPTDRGSNLQNVPRDPRVRAVFVSDPGLIFGYADLKSAESMVVAHITGDAEMLRLHSPEYLTGERDGHRYVASFLLDRPIELITKDERYLGKRVRHAGNYGMSWFKLMQLVNADAQETGVSINAAQAKALINKYRRLHPGLEIWWRDVERNLYVYHKLLTLHRRPHNFYGRPQEILPEAIAFVPQGTVADTLNIGLLRVSPANYYTDRKASWIELDHKRYAAFEEDCHELEELGFQALLQVHDAIGFQALERNLDRTVPLLVKAMTMPFTISQRFGKYLPMPYNFTIPVDVQVGLNWGEFDPKHPELNPNGLRGYVPASRFGTYQTALGSLQSNLS